MPDEALPFTPLSHQEMNDLRLRIVRSETDPSVPEPTIEEIMRLGMTLRTEHSSKSTPKEKPAAKGKKGANADLVDLDMFLVTPEGSGKS